MLALHYSIKLGKNVTNVMYIQFHYKIIIMIKVEIINTPSIWVYFLLFFRSVNDLNIVLGAIYISHNLLTMGQCTHCEKLSHYL